MRKVAAREARSFSIKLSFFFGALFVVYGIQLPYFPVWLDHRGLTPAEIGLVSSAPLFLRVFIGPAAAFLADRSGDHRRAVLMASLAAFAAVAALTHSVGLPAILLLTAVFLAGVQTGGPIGEAIALAGVRDWGVDYGRMRLWGSLSFILATAAGGAFLGQLGATSVIWMLLASTFGLVAAAWLLPVPSPDRMQEGTSRRPLTFSEVARVAGSGAFLLFLISAGMIQASHAVFYGFGVLHWQTQGIAGSTISLLWSTSIIAEIALFAFAGRFLATVGPLGLILAGGAAAVVRWTAMALNPPVALLLPLQVLHALTFGATHLGAMQYIQRAIPHEQAGTAQALLAAATGGIGMGAAMLLAGILYGPYGSLSYLAMAAIAGVGLAAALPLRSRGMT
jgi:PPP family 3-phenylpropionic acid transporter